MFSSAPPSLPSDHTASGSIIAPAVYSAGYFNSKHTYAVSHGWSWARVSSRARSTTSSFLAWSVLLHQPSSFARVRGVFLKANGGAIQLWTHRLWFYKRNTKAQVSAHGAILLCCHADSLRWRNHTCGAHGAALALPWILLYGSDNCHNWIMMEGLVDRLDAFQGELAKRVLR